MDLPLSLSIPPKYVPHIMSKLSFNFIRKASSPPPDLFWNPSKKKFFYKGPNILKGEFVIPHNVCQKSHRFVLLLLSKDFTAPATTAGKQNPQDDGQPSNCCTPPESTLCNVSYLQKIELPVLWPYLRRKLRRRLRS